LHLIVQEAAEIAEALSHRDERALADGLADLRYVTEGTAVAFSIPLQECMEAIHASNMTKDKAGGDGTLHPTKGDDYQEPQLFRAITSGRVAAHERKRLGQ